MTIILINLQNNTFQCVMVTDGRLSFVMFLYADGLIQWLWSDDHVGNPAEVGINAGDGIHFFRHPDSNTTRLLNITLTSNVGIPGVWVVRTDKEGLPIEECRKGKNGIIILGQEKYGISLASRQPLLCQWADIVDCSVLEVWNHPTFIN